ncbi:hypothetical protein [Streptomyces tsukubensis]|uniref:Uncharacterized protein n=1 Tax=Streptomyces tsukubensis TaxID=83656 RepID=A0A1V4A772_9ACTN|nr:hypothetical protein [Streptomyces tsukubensis]OON77715.1 hypothetical protein B1H18_18555 [Streptomyces tsukubensis]QFR93229.1 hypothetical protein GBW32_09190 [Streptomyces tsukubensis]
MTVPSGIQDEPSEWATERFGSHAHRLVAAIPQQLAKAHVRAHAGHLAAGLKKRSPYGVVLAQAVRENLADMARELGEAVRDVRGYEYAVVNDHALFPFKYADRPKPFERARLAANASPTRRRMLLSHGPDPQEGLFSLDDEYTTEKYEDLHETFEALGASTKLVCLIFTADPEGGIHVIHWGDAHLEPDRTFTWLHHEQLRVAALPPG